MFALFKCNISSNHLEVLLKCNSSFDDIKQIFAHGRFPEVGKKQKTEERERKKERLNDGNNNGQATHGARKHAWRTQAAWAN